MNALNQLSPQTKNAIVDYETDFRVGLRVDLDQLQQRYPNEAELKAHLDEIGEAVAQKARENWLSDDGLQYCPKSADGVAAAAINDGRLVFTIRTNADAFKTFIERKAKELQAIDPAISSNILDARDAPAQLPNRIKIQLDGSKIVVGQNETKEDGYVRVGQNIVDAVGKGVHKITADQDGVIIDNLSPTSVVSIQELLDAVGQEKSLKTRRTV